MIKLIRELIRPELKGNKWWEYTEVENPRLCSFFVEKTGETIGCQKEKKHGMRNKEKDEFLCPKCYINEVGGELKVTLPKRKLALYITGGCLIILIQFAIILSMIIPKAIYHVDPAIREFLIETYYPLAHETVSRNTFTTIVDAILEHSSIPELSFAIIYHESRFNPAAVSKTGARGLHQIISRPGWVPRLTQDGIIKEVGDLHDPVIGVIAGDAVLGYHFAEVGGDLMKALNNYVGSNDHPGNNKYVRDVLATYGAIKLLEKGKFKSDSWRSMETKTTPSAPRQKTEGRKTK